MSISRRTLGVVAASGAGALGLAACSGDQTSQATDPAADQSPPTTSSSPPAGGGGTLAATSDIPVGGCVVFGDQQVVVTQPNEGEFKAFSSICTHERCTVSSATEGFIPCKCHGSEFSLSDGSVLKGPATQPLAEVEIAVKGAEISLA